jgi:hypothetical protein
VGEADIDARKTLATAERLKERALDQGGLLFNMEA